MLVTGSCLCRYGDKAPKSTLARSFAVVWIIIGVTVCSVMTATLSSALTSVKIEKYDVTTGKRVGFSELYFKENS